MKGERTRSLVYCQTNKTKILCRKTKFCGSSCAA